MPLITSISGIRGTIGGKEGENLTPPDIVKFTQAYAALLKSKFSELKKIRVLVGRDGRISGEAVSGMVCATLNLCGIDVLDAGLSTTPTVEIGVPEKKCQGGIIITASHNPFNWNALKLLNENGEFISEEEGQRLLEFTQKPFQYPDALKLGTTKKEEGLIDLHVEKILNLKLVKPELIKKKKLTVVCDTINSTGSIALKKLLQALGIPRYFFINEEINGRFAHNPEPLPEHLNDLSKEVIKRKADLGVAVDPDVDRLVLVCEYGDFFGEEYTLVSVADYVLSESGKKQKTVSNLSSTQALEEITRKRGGTHYASPVGEVHVVKKMKEVGAIIGGEGNGGVIYPELHYGRDALVGLALFLSYLASSGKTASELRKTYPNYYISKNKLELQPSWDPDEVLARLHDKYKKRFTCITDDGLKILLGKEWVHLRKSNTEPIIRIYTESTSQLLSENLAKQFIQEVGSIVKEFIID